MARTAKRQTGLLGDLPKQVDRVQADLDKALRRTWKRAMDALPNRTQKAVKNLTRQVEKQAADLEKRRKQAVKRVEKQAAELEKRRKQAVKAAETRRKRLVSEFESRATDAGKTVVERLDLASGNELDRLSRRVAQLERRLRAKPARKAPTKAAA